MISLKPSSSSRWGFIFVPPSLQDGALSLSLPSSKVRLYLLSLPLFKGEARRG
tara:strand:+ start:172 stop:330 length:159 start_codon:yes stop_codon:yes gene_type:complete